MYCVSECICSVQKELNFRDYEEKSVNKNLL